MASQRQSRPSTEQLSKGLDRAAYNVYDNLERHLISPLQPGKPEELTSSSSGSKVADEDLKPDVKGKIHRISKKFSNNVKSKADIVLHPTQHKKEKSTDPNIVPALAPPPTDKADNDRLFHDSPHQTGPRFQDVSSNIQFRRLRMPSIVLGEPNSRLPWTIRLSLMEPM